MQAYKVSSDRAATMRRRLGEASKLIADDHYLPLYRNRQINYPEEFAHSVIVAKQKRYPGRYLAKIWAKENIAASIEMLRKLINLARTAIAHQLHKRQAAATEKQIADERAKNQHNLDRLALLKKQCFNFQN